MKTPRPLIAIVDQDESVRKAVKRLIRAAGFHAETFGSGTEFLHAIRMGVPDCLVLDAQMPSLNGLDLQDRVTAAGTHLPIIFISGHEDPPAEERALRAGAVAFLLKPFTCQSLMEAIYRVLGQVGRN